MNEESFNTGIRKLLKQVGVTSQREIEKAVDKAIANGELQGNETLRARIKVHVDGLELDHTIEGDIPLE